ncbi:hypothetical protein GCM10009682_40580 [Luedemannella flava]|uniref:Uncharacterized protein n=2 Tax=Luedemannella flava TaxID=349316 RepID=A0ABN2M953_9ACTN
MPGKSWTVASAARFAREARMSTVAHLQTAPIARQLRQHKLTRAYAIHRANTGSREAAMDLLFGGLGYKRPYPADWAEAAELLTSDEARCLAAAELYVLTPQMCDVVIAAAQGLTRDDLQLLAEDDLPSPTGLLVLPHPVLVRSVGGDLGDVRALCWHPGQFNVPDPLAADGVRGLPGVRIAVFHDTSGPVRPDSFLELVAEARREGTPLPPLLLDAVRCLEFQTQRATDPHEVERLASAAQAVDGAYRKSAEMMGQDEGRLLGEYASGSEIDDADDSFAWRFLYAFWRLCEQRIAGVEQAETNHAARVIGQRAGLSPDVRVIRLRQRDERAAGEPVGRNWQHRWVVRMHKVRQWYPSEQRHKVIYRGPYIKGPDGKPLLGGETVRALVR